MSVAEEIAQAMNALYLDGADPTVEDLAAAIMPLVKQSQAEAIREVADSRQAEMFSPAVYLGPQRKRAFISARDWLHCEADRIEGRSER